MSSRYCKLIGWAFLLILVFFEKPSMAREEGRSLVTEGTGEAMKGQAEERVEKPLSLSSISGPILGYVFDQSKGGLRPILGIAGASTLGEVVNLEKDLARGWISPQQNYALAEAKDNGELLLLGLEGEAISLRPVVGARAGADQIYLSPSGASAALLYRGRQNLQLLSGLPQAPVLLAEVDLSGWADSLTALAVSDDARAVLLAVAEAGTGSVYLLAGGKEVRVVTTVGRASVMSFLRQRQDALIADLQANEVLLIRNVAETAAKITLASEREGISQPVAVEASEDNKHVFIANSGSRTVSALELETGAITHLSCGGVPTGLYRLRGSSVFRLNGLTEDPVLLLDGGAAEPRILFVPADQARTDPPQDFVVPDRGQARPLRIPERRSQP